MADNEGNGNMGKGRQGREERGEARPSNDQPGQYAWENRMSPSGNKSLEIDLRFHGNRLYSIYVFAY